MSKRSMAARTAAWVAAALCAALVAPLDAKEIFRGRMLTGRAPIEPPYVDVQLEIESWTTPEEVRQLNDVLMHGGQEAFLAAFSAAKKGVVRFLYARGYNMEIHMAQVLPTEKGRKVLVLLNRQAWSQGSYLVRGRNYFMVIELDLNEKGRGEGRFYEDAQIQLDPNLGKIQMGNYDSAPKVFVQVQEVVRKEKPPKK